MPNKHIRTAFELYQPSGIKGRLLKKCFPYLKNFSFVRSRLDIKLVSPPLTREFIEVCNSIFNSDNLEFSLFLGTPSPHQKTTIQIFKKDRILGYAKISDREGVTGLFSREDELLTYLHKAGIDDIPNSLFCKKLKDGDTLFIQDTRKRGGNQSPRLWTEKHERFIQQLCAKTSRSIEFKKSDFYTSLTYLRDNLERIKDKNIRMTVSSSLEAILGEYGENRVTFSVYHADFTPWNMFMNDNRLFVFDWEYSSKTYPSGLDKYHFHIQQWIHVDHLNADIIFEKLCETGWFESVSLRIYLTDIISRYLKREEETFSTSFIHSLNIWTNLLRKIEEN